MRRNPEQGKEDVSTPEYTRSFLIQKKRDVGEKGRETGQGGGGEIIES